MAELVSPIRNKYLCDVISRTNSARKQPILLSLYNASCVNVWSYYQAALLLQSTASSQLYRKVGCVED